ncbi:unnamed protein product, partial [Prorocentrum cordatum]
VGLGFQRRRRDAWAVQRCQKQRAMGQAVRAETAAFASQTLPANQFPEVDGFFAHFNQPCHRRPVLAIVGGTVFVKKNMLAADVFRRLGFRLATAASAPPSLAIVGRAQLGHH